MPNKPHCLLIGAQHAGTSWLWNVLKQHPQTSFPKTKENHFFGSAELYRKGLPWYFSHFEGLDDSKIICDAATTNFYDRVPYWYNAKNEVEYDDSLPTIPELIVDAIPDVKIIVSLRDPVSRTISSYRHWMRHQFVLSTIRKRRVSPWLGLKRTALSFPKVRMLEYGYYSRYLAEWKKFVPEDRLLVLIFEEEIKQSPQKGIKKVLEFMQIDSDFALKTDRSSSNPSWKWSRIVLNYYTKPVMRWIDRGPIHWIANTWDPLRDFEFKDSDLEFLRAAFKDEKKNLEAMIGRNLDCWRHLN